MPLTPSTEQSIHRVFREGFAARDIAEPLASFDATTEIDLVRDFMVRRPLSIVGLRRDGLISGYVEEGQLDRRPLEEQAAPLTDAAIVSTSAPFREIILTLRERPFLLVAVMGQPVGVIMRNDVQKAPVRMWLFDMVTNNLAHSQDILAESWDMIVALAEDLDNILEEPEHLSPQDSHTPY